MSTNIGKAPLGSLILGATYVEPVNTSVTNNYSPSQTISIAGSVHNLTVTSSYTPISRVNRTISLSLINTNTLSQLLVLENFTPLARVDTYTLTQNITSRHITNQLIVHNYSLSHTRNYNAVFNKTFNQPINISQTILGERVKPVLSNYSLSQVVSYVKTKIITHSIPWQQDLNKTTIFVRSINSLIIPFQSISRLIKLTKQVNQTNTFSQTINQINSLNITNNYNLNQTIFASQSRLVKNTISYNQTISFNQVHNIRLTSSYFPISTVNLNTSTNVTVSHGFGLNSFQHQYKQFNLSINNNLNLTNNIAFNVYTRTINHNIILVSSLTYKPIYPRIINSLINLSQTVNYNLVSGQTITSNLVFPSERTIYIGLGENNYTIINNIQFAVVPSYDYQDYQFNVNDNGQFWYTKPRKKKNKPHCVLRTNNAVITLPNPNFNDSENYGGIFNLRRAMNGVPYTYIRGLELRKIKLPFSLDKVKAYELRDFLIQNNTKLMDLSTWKGDKWIVHLMTNPTEFTPTSRYLNAREKVDVSLEFEGLKVM